MASGLIHKLLYKMAWDTKCRNVDVVRILKPLIDRDSTILDAGCGDYGFAAFASAKSVVGLDVFPAEARVRGIAFVRGSITSLPFAERSFAVSTSIDVLEHLPESIRANAIKQLVKVSDHLIVITFPSGEQARKIDEEFNRQLIESNKPIPDWLAEHLEHPYPAADSVAAEIENEAHKLNRKVRTTVFYSENLGVTRSLRWSAARSRYLYLVGNLATGLLMAFLPRANKENAYRSIIVAEFDNA